jgi:hypothetical protein
VRLLGEHPEDRGDRGTDRQLGPKDQQREQLQYPGFSGTGFGGIEHEARRDVPGAGGCVGVGRPERHRVETMRAGEGHVLPDEVGDAVQHDRPVDAGTRAGVDGARDNRKVGLPAHAAAPREP